jgi:hypothetical protein
MTLKDGLTFTIFVSLLDPLGNKEVAGPCSGGSDVPSGGVPDPYAGIQTAGRYPVAVECNGIDLAVVSLKCMEASPFGDAPYSSGRVVATGNNNISLDFKATNTSLMPHKDVSAESGPDIPNPKSRISRA